MVEIKSRLPEPNLDKFELASTVQSIKEWEKDGIDCTALKDYISPLLKRVNLNSLLDNREKHE